jgi:hypothetical protein
MKRREVITLLSGTAWPLAARAPIRQNSVPGIEGSRLIQDQVNIRKISPIATNDL